jgi:hypothetical protein
MNQSECEAEIGRLNGILSRQRCEKCSGCDKFFYDADLLECDHCGNFFCKDCLHSYSEGTSTEAGFMDDDFAICKGCARKD